MTPSNEQMIAPLPARLVRPTWRDPVLVGAALVVVGLLVYQFVVTLLRPPWLGLATSWLLAVLAGLGLLVVALFSWWTSRAHLPASWSWWLISVALLCYALAQSLWLVSYVSSPDHLPFPWWSDLFLLLQFPCFFLAMLLVPDGEELYRLPGLARLRLFFDSLLLMGAVTFLTWEFLLEEIPQQSRLWFPDKVTHLAYPIADLGLLFLLTRFFLQPRRSQASRAALGLLIVAFLCFILGNSWYASTRSNRLCTTRCRQDPCQRNAYRKILPSLCQNRQTTN